jgi:CheY-like chemotaxis protein
VQLSWHIDTLVGIVEPSLGTIRIRTSVPSGTWSAWADPGALESALLSLIHNARDAMPGGGTMEIACANQPAIGAGRNMVRITVADTGRGMDEGTRVRAVDPFFTTKPFGIGSGLGLSGVAGFVRQSGGSIQIDSAPGQGTTVTLTLPCVQAVGPRPAAAPDAVTVLVAGGGSGADRRAEALLGELGYTVLAADTPRQALELLDEPQRVDVVLMDVLLAGPMSGIELARALRQRAPELPIAFMSSLPRARGAGTTGGDVLAGPFSAQRLDAHIRQALTGMAEPR